MKFHVPCCSVPRVGNSRSAGFQSLETGGARSSNHWKSAAALALAVALPSLRAAPLSQPVSDIDPRSGISIRVESAFDRMPNAGFAPLRVVIKNDSSLRRTWDFSFVSASAYGERATFRSGTSVDCDAKAERVVEIMVPLAVQGGGYMYPQLTTQVSGYGCGGGARHLWSGGYSSYGGHPATAFIAMADSLALTAWSVLEAKLTGASSSGPAARPAADLAGVRFDAAKAPGDWRGWMGCDSVWLSDGDWAGLDNIRRQALLDWLKLGGRLHVCFAGGDRNGALTDLPPDEGPVGLGRFARVTASDTTKFVDHVARTIRAEPRIVDTISSGYVPNWGLRAGIPPIVVHTGLILAFVCLFAALIGPVNLFLLARRKKHMHLFWTTPALSLLASLALALIIVLQDGFGGKGNRFNAVYLDAAAHKAFTVQEQVSRSGVLLSRRLPVRDPLFLTHVVTDSATDRRSRDYAFAGDAFTGDWFSSRTVDGHLLAAVQPTRGRVEIAVANGTPTVTSSLGATLETLYYRDIRQQVWTVAALKTGERKMMQPATGAALGDFLRKQTAPCGGYLSPRLADLAGQDRFFFASVASPTEQVIPTLPSIVWKQSGLLYFGPAVETGGGP